MLAEWPPELPSQEIPQRDTALRGEVKSDQDKEHDAKEAAEIVAKKHGNTVPSVRDHTTETMAILKEKHPGNHAKREDVSRIIGPAYKGRRRSPGNPHKANPA
jgi:hypothetical protein